MVVRADTQPVFWGVGRCSVWQWRKALGVGQMTEGTTALKSERLSPVLERAREAAAPTLSAFSQPECTSFVPG